ncbi:MAG: hypothetical protein AVDCRST_MAG76-2954, partial [uncultured Acidimicrobiales bacterium]
VEGPQPDRVGPVRPSRRPGAFRTNLHTCRSGNDPSGV